MECADLVANRLSSLNIFTIPQVACQVLDYSHLRYTDMLSMLLCIFLKIFYVNIPPPMFYKKEEKSIGWCHSRQLRSVPLWWRRLETLGKHNCFSWAALKLAWQLSFLKWWPYFQILRMSHRFTIFKFRGHSNCKRWAPSRRFWALLFVYVLRFPCLMKSQWDWAGRGRAFLVTTQTPQMNWYIEKYLFPPKLKKMNLL